MRPVVRADGLKCSRTMLHSGSAQVGDAAPVGGGAATPGTTVGGTGTEAASLKGQQDCVLDAVLGGDPQRPNLSIILPLNLVRRLVGRLNHPGPGAELKELDPPKGLGE